MWLDPKETSEWAYWYCFELSKGDENDVESVWKLIEDPYWAFAYCQNVEDKIEVRDKIKNDRCRYLYCRYVTDRLELWSKIRDNEHSYKYCKTVKIRPELFNNIKWLREEEWIDKNARSCFAYERCLYLYRNCLEDKEEWWKLINTSREAELYYLHIKSRPELLKIAKGQK